MKKGIVLLYLFLCGIGLTVVKAQAVTDLTTLGYSEAVANQLLQQRMLENRNNGAIIYLPSSAYLSSTIAEQINALKPEVAIERLYYIEAPLANRLQLFNNVLKLSSLSGLQYRGNRNRIETMITQAGTVANATSTIIIPDAVLTQRPRSYQTFLYQDDALFGSDTWTANYFAQADELALVFTNNADIRWQRIFTLATAGNLKTILYCVPVNGGYVLYTALFNAREGRGLGSSNARHQLLSNRLEAYQNWFAALYQQ